MKLKTLAVIVQTDDGENYQVALTDEMINILKNDLSNYFKGGVIKIIPKEINSIEFIHPDYTPCTECKHWTDFGNNVGECMNGSSYRYGHVGEPDEDKCDVFESKINK